MLFGTDFFLILAAFSVAAPWTQGWGRIRCLVQGCCHGKITSSNIGIRYFHERSRVVGISELTGEYLHPTPVYSILTNIVIGIFLAKLWLFNAPLTFIIGIYLILSGLGRFAEEHYRGEPQTPIIAGLRLYQWIALIGTITGAFFTTISHPVDTIDIQLSTETLIIATLLGLLAIFLTGIDFPHSNRRFSRLA
ncbi:MAG: prolipoprotein diacylglyceryl transferase family protein [bacterium]